MRRQTFVALVLLGSSLLGACGGDTGAPGPGGGTSAEVTASDFSFSPTTIEVDPGTSLELTLMNEGSATHSLTFEEPQFDVEASAGSEVTGTFDVPDGDATYSFICRYHPDTMSGEIVAGSGGESGGAPKDPESEAPGDDGAYDY